MYKIWGRNKTLLGPFRCNLRTVCIVLVWISGWQPVIGHFQDGTVSGRDTVSAHISLTFKPLVLYRCAILRNDEHAMDLCDS